MWGLEQHKFPSLLKGSFFKMTSANFSGSCSFFPSYFWPKSTFIVVVIIHICGHKGALVYFWILFQRDLKWDLVLSLFYFKASRRTETPQRGHRWLFSILSFPLSFLSLFLSLFLPPTCLLSELFCHVLHVFQSPQHKIWQPLYPLRRLSNWDRCHRNRVCPHGSTVASVRFF